jgi:hypothetical protein
MSTRALALSVDNSFRTKLLPGVLSVVAGSVDVISFLGLEGSSQRITGNLVVLAAHVATGRAAALASIPSVPVFIAVLGLTRLAAAGVEESGHGPLQPLRALQVILLVSFLAVWVAEGVGLDPIGAWSSRKCRAYGFDRCADCRCAGMLGVRRDGGAERSRAVVSRGGGACGDDDRHHDVHDRYRRDVVPARP